MTTPSDHVELAQRLLLERYLELLYAESNRLNLTRVPRADAWARHVEESLDLLPLREWSPGERVLDLGSGGGIPGIPLAIALPQLLVGLIERDRAKSAFLLSCLGRLGLPGVHVLAQDALELARGEGFQPADVLVSRAALPVPALLSVAVRLLRVGGDGLVHVGASLMLDDNLGKAAARAGLSELHLERSGRSRVLHFARRAVG